MFDSGFGGLTVARAVIDLLPAEALVYVGDTGRYPYGPRPLDEVRDFAVQIGTWLVERHDVKVLVVACNTAAAAALDELADRLGVPVIGVIEPGVRAMLSATRSGHVGVIGTVGTVSSGAYQRMVHAMSDDVKLTCAACPGFVEFVERGDFDGDQVHVLAERLLAPMQDAGVDTLLLGCTHYPYLARTIADVMGRDVVLVSSADETAFALAAELAGPGPAPDRHPPVARHRWFSSGDLASFQALGRQLLGPELDQAEGLDWDAPTPTRAAPFGLETGHGERERPR